MVYQRQAYTVYTAYTVYESYGMQFQMLFGHTFVFSDIGVRKKPKNLKA